MTNEASFHTDLSLYFKLRHTIPNIYYLEHVDKPCMQMCSVRHLHICSDMVISHVGQIVLAYFFARSVCPTVSGSLTPRYVVPIATITASGEESFFILIEYTCNISKVKSFIRTPYLYACTTIFGFFIQATLYRYVKKVKG